MIAVLLLVFGCPDSLESIEPFITNVMGGRKPSPEQLQKIKERYRIIGGRSPLLDITRRQAEALERILNEVKEFWSYRVQELTPKLQNSKTPELFRVFVGMRHWHPFIKDTLKEIVNSGARKIVALIMSPHYSKFSTEGYIKAINNAKAELTPPFPPLEKGGEGGLDISFVKSWHTHPLFLEAVADEIKKGLSYFKDVDRNEVHVIFSAHSLPINEGRGTRDEGIGEELYLRQLNETIEGIIKLTGNISWHLGFQSKPQHLDRRALYPATRKKEVTLSQECRAFPTRCRGKGMSPGKWIEPTVDSILERLSKEGKKYVLIVPIGFVSDHIETLYDIDIVYKGRAESLGMKFYRTNSLNDSPKFIESLSDIVIEHLRVLTKIN